MFEIQKVYVYSFLIYLSISCLVNCQDSSTTSPEELSISEFEKLVTEGVEVDSSKVYQAGNGSRSASEQQSELRSSPGCPQPYKGQPWVYYGDPVRCHLAGFRWPCPKSMRLFGQTTSPYGYCDCDCDSYRGDVVNIPQAYCYSLMDDGIARTLVYVSKWKACHSLFDKGQCRNNQWLVLGDDPRDGPFCERRTCPEDPIDQSRFTYYDYNAGTCRKIRDQCESPEPPSQLTQQQIQSGGGVQRRMNYRYQVGKTDWRPKCLVDELSLLPGGSKYASGSVRQLQCYEGERYSPILGQCVRSYSGGGDFG